MGTHKGETKCLTDWAKGANINKGTFRCRIVKLNWTIKKALTTPVKTNN